MDERTRLNLLYDFYGNLLTDRQQELFQHHYQYDLSLGEIAENFQISRQAVHDLLRRTIAQLNNYENRLQLLERHFQRQELLAQLDSALVAADLTRARALTEKLKNT
jgi:predicted DNA-binding protein YlxM (UPF0122 family)